MAGLAAVTLVAGSGSRAAAFDEYRLGIEDRVRLRVTEWKAERGDAFTWEAMSGEFTVDAAGRLSLPLVGQIVAAGRTTAEIGDDISDRLKQRVGLVQSPHAALEIARYRSIFVLGYVDKPGPYPYQPRLSVLQAVGLAGGVYRLPDAGLQRLGREAIGARGDLRDLMTERVALILRRARLEAEMRDEATITLPELSATDAETPAIQTAIAEEKALFETRRDALTSQVAALTQAKELLRNEIDTLNAKLASQDRQLGLARKELDSIKGLVERGLAINPRQLALEQTVAQMESARLDTLLGVSRSRQDVSRNDRTILDLRNARRSSVLVDLREAQTRLTKLQERLATTRNLLSDTETAAPRLLQSAREARRPPTYVVVRQEGERSREITVGEGDAIQPGDVIKVVPAPIDEGDQISSPAQRPGQGGLALVR